MDLVLCRCLYLIVLGYIRLTFHKQQYANEDLFCIERKRLLIEVVQYHGNLRAQVSKLSRGSSLSKISLIFWTCCAGRIRY